MSRTLVMPSLRGSHQNPAFSPDGSSICFTVFHKGYNESPAGIYKVSLTDKVLNPVKLVDDGNANVSQPGSCWSPKSGRIIYSSTYYGDDDWPCSMKADGTDQRSLTKPQDGFMGYEPTWAADGVTFAFERHVSGQGKNGQIVIVRDGKFKFVSVGDSRQPCWSGDGKYLIWQTVLGSKWDLWLMDINGAQARQLTRGIDATDATFHPDSNRILFSSDGGLWETDVKGKKPVNIVESPTEEYYLGAPSWSPNGKLIACEASDTDADGGPGTRLELHSIA